MLRTVKEGMRDSIFAGSCQRLRRVICEGDSSSLIRGIAKQQTFIQIQAIVDDILTLISTLTLDFMFFRRQCNWVAHNLAAKVLRDDCFLYNPLEQVTSVSSLMPC